MDEVQRHSVHTLVFRSLKRSHDLFVSNQNGLPDQDEETEKLRFSLKARDMYSQVFSRVAATETERKKAEYFGKPMESKGNFIILGNRQII